MSEEKSNGIWDGPYLVYVDDNFNFMDEDERHPAGRFATFEAAEERSKGIVDAYLKSNYKPGMKAEDLYDTYNSFGDDPFIMGPDSMVTVVNPSTGKPESKPRFSAWEYAKARCREICEKNEKHVYASKPASYG